MLNINFIYILIYFPILVFLFINFNFIVINYYISVKNIIFTKNKNKKKSLKNTEISNLNLNKNNQMLVIINYIYFNFKLNINLNSELNFYNFFILLLVILSFILINVTFLFNRFELFFKKIINYNNYISVFFIVVVFIIFFIDNFFLFFFFIELLSYIFYLQFMQIFNKLKTNNLKNYYLDSLLIFYWVNFFGTLFLIASIYILFSKFNTTNYYDLINFYNYKKIINIFLFFFFLGFNIKLGISGFHFLKLDVYKNLKIDSIINFSFFSLTGYIILIKIISILTPLFFNYIYFLIFFILIFGGFLIFGIKLKNIILFFGYSSILNVSLLLFILI